MDLLAKLMIQVAHPARGFDLDRLAGDRHHGIEARDAYLVVTCR
jgi:hypothetical protein